MQYKELYKLVHKKGICPIVQFTPHVRALGIVPCPDPFTRARLISVSQIDNENRIEFVFDLNGFEEFNNGISSQSFPGGIFIAGISLFSHFGNNEITFFTQIHRGEQSGKSLKSQLSDLISIAEMFNLYDAADYLRGIINRVP